MVDAAAAVLATVVVLVILAAGCLWGVRRARRRRAGFMPGDAATPKIREAVALVGRDLACISGVAAAVDARGDALERAGGAGAAEGAAAGDAVAEGAPAPGGAAAGGAAAEGTAARRDALADARARLVEARGGVRGIVESVRRLRATLDAMPPTYQNALGLYRGLRDGDLALQSAAAGLGAAGARMLTRVGEAPEDEDAAEAAEAAELRAAAFQLGQMKACFASLVRSVHLLGDALQLE